VITRQHFGVIIPFADSLKLLLSMPEVWHHIQTPKTAHDEVMRDVCDGYIWQEHKLFQQNPSALQIFLNTDDLECGNPVGCHVKKTQINYVLLHAWQHSSTVSLKIDIHSIAGNCKNKGCAAVWS